MSEKTSGQELDSCDVFSTEIGGMAVKMLLTRPEGAPSGIVIPVFSGLASGPELHGPVAKKLSEYGHIVARVWQEGASEHGVRAAKYVMTSLVQGSFNGRTVELPAQRQVVTSGHSLGVRKEVVALAELYEAGDTDINAVIMEAGACLGGVSPYKAPVDAFRSIAQEIHHMTVSGAIEHRGVAMEGARSVKALGRQVAREVSSAMRSSVEPQIRELQQAGVTFVAVDHPDDLLVIPQKNQATYRKLGIPYIEVEAPLAGHNVQLYYPQQTAAAVHAAQEVARSQYEKAA